MREKKLLPSAKLKTEALKCSVPSRWGGGGEQQNELLVSKIDVEGNAPEKITVGKE